MMNRFQPFLQGCRGSCWSTERPARVFFPLFKHMTDDLLNQELLSLKRW